MGSRDDAAALRELRQLLRRAVSTVLRRRDPVLVAVGAITLGALALRLFALGARPAHFDEGRVAYWALRFQETDNFAYRHIIHGPFVQHVLRLLFGWFGPSDVLSRLPVAIVGGLFPLSALLFREHLRDDETVILALLLATNAVLLYYSRFLRSDVLVAAFMFTAFGFLVRLYDTRNVRYLYGVAVFLAFGIGAKENSILYVLTWLGGAALLLDVALLRPRNAASGVALVRRKIAGPISPLVSAGRALRTGDRRAAKEHLPSRWTVARTLGMGLGALLLFALLFVFLFAPRGSPGDVMPWLGPGATEAVTFWEAARNPLRVPDLVFSTVDYWRTEYFTWFDTSSPGSEGWVGKYEKFGPQFETVLFRYATPTMVFAAVGFLRERYAASTSRNLVLFFAYGGFVSALAYPLAMDIFGPWNAVHAVVPLTVPAAAGLAAVYRHSRAAIERNNGAGISVGTLLAVIVLAQIALPAYGAVYADPASRDNKLVQYAQPEMELRDTLEAVELESVAARNSDTDVLVYGTSFVAEGNSTAFLPACMGGWGGWSSALPIPWYLHAADAEVACARSSAELSGSLADSPPPVVVTKSTNLPGLEQRWPGYEVYENGLRTFGPEVVFMINRSAIE